MSRGCRSAARACPFFGQDVERLAPRPGRRHRRDRRRLARRHACAILPAGDYYVQGFVNVYSEFRRADGHVLWMHDDQWEGQRWNRSPGNMLQRRPARPLGPDGRRRRGAHGRPGDSADRGAGRHDLREAVQVPEPHADEVLGAAHLPGRDGAPAARLRHLHDQLPGELHPGALQPRASPYRFDGEERVLAGVAERRVPAADCRDVPAPDAVLRRLLRGQLGQRRPLRRRDHAGADPGDREALSGDPRAVGARGCPAARPAAGRRSRSRSSIPTSSAARGRRAPTR